MCVCVEFYLFSLHLGFVQYNIGLNLQHTSCVILCVLLNSGNLKASPIRILSYSHVMMYFNIVTFCYGYFAFIYIVL